MDRLQAMTTFVAVVDSGGFASAARTLKQSPPVVTRAVAELEERLELRLLTRTTRFVRVTDAGARFAEDCRRILADIEEAETTATGTHAAPRGMLTITAPVLFGHLHVTPILVNYLQQFPEVNAQCLFLDRVLNVVEEGIDVAVHIGELPDSLLQATRVGRVRRVRLAAPSYLKAHGVPQRPQDLADHTIVSASGVSPVSEWRFSNAGKPLLQRMQPGLCTWCTTRGGVRRRRYGRLSIWRWSACVGTLHCADLEGFEGVTNGPRAPRQARRSARRCAIRQRQLLLLPVSRPTPPPRLRWRPTHRPTAR